MDLISRVLSLIPVSGHLDVRCHFGVPWEIVQTCAIQHVIPYHVVLSGEAVLETDNAPSERLQAGDIVLFPAGGAHRIHDGSGKPALPAVERRGNAFVTAVNGDHAGHEGHGGHADILCGRFLIGAVPQRLLADYLPGRMVVRTGAASAPTPATQRTDPREITDAADASDKNTASDVAGTRLTRLITLMKEETADDAPGAETVVDHLSAALFALTLRFAGTGQDAPRGLLALSARPRLQAAIAAMFDSPEKHWTLDQFAALCNMSKATFVRQFQEAIGRSATDMLTEVRMTLAGRTLKQQTRLSVAEVAEQVGYQSEAAFQRIFKQYTGVTPAKYRASHPEP